MTTARTSAALACLIVGNGCGETDLPAGATSALEPQAPTPVAVAPAAAAAAVAAPAVPPTRVSYTGDWSIADAPFVPEAALAIATSDGAYEIVVSSPPIDCDFVRRGGQSPPNLRRLSIRGVAGSEQTSDPANPQQQINFIHDGESRMNPGTMTLYTIAARGTFTIAPQAGNVVHVTVAANAGSFQPPISRVSGSVEAILCD